MTRKLEHIHVSEQETQHLWPDGRLDDAAWEDCLWSSAIEWLRATGLNIPATHQEAEALRAASGQGPTGGSRWTDLLKGCLNRYNHLLPPVTVGADQIRAAMGVGSCAIVNGPYSAAPRKLQQRDSFWHSVYVERRGEDAWFWCDPIGGGSYAGVMLTWAELAPFAREALVGRIAQKEDDMSVVDYKEELWAVTKGTPFYDAPGGNQIGTFSADAQIRTVGAPFKPDGSRDWSWRLALVVTQALTAGMQTPKLVWVPRAKLTYVGPYKTDCSAEVKAAVAAERARWESWLADHPAD
jgi:hypothetical protein